jgi:hypothetical protein
MKSSIDTPTQATEPNDASAQQRPLEPVRMLAGGGSALERRLLASAGVDQMPHASRQRLQRELAVVAAAPRTGSPGSGLGASRFVRHASFAGLGALALLGAWAARGPLPAAPPEMASPEMAPPVALAPVSAGQLTASPATPLLVLAPDSAPDVAPSAPLPDARHVSESATAPRVPHADASNARATTAPITPVPKAAPASGGLREELRLLESAQTALRTGRVNDAQRALDEHANRFEEGELALEAELLSIEVSLARGQRPQAQARARRLLARPGAARYRQRLEALQRAGHGHDSDSDNGASSDGVNPRTVHMNERRSSP